MLQVKDESKMGVSSSFMLKPAAQASPMAADASPMASFDGAFTTAASSQAPPPAPVTRGNRRIFTPLAANPALPDEDVAPEAGPTAGGHSSMFPYLVIALYQIPEKLSWKFQIFSIVLFLPEVGPTAGRHCGAHLLIYTL